MFFDKPFFWLAASFFWIAGVLGLALGPQHGGDWLLKTFGDKVLHSAAFTIGCFCWAKALQARERSGNTAPLVAGAITLVVGALVEYLQSFTVTRQAEAADLLADAIGIVPVVFLMTIVRKRS